MAHSVVIIGNGFDLNLGMKTSYRDYIRSPFFRDCLNIGHQLFDYLDEQTNIENWIDIEKELAIFSKEKNTSDSFIKDYFLLCETLKNYLSSLDLLLINQETEAYKFITKSFNENTIILNFNYTDSVNYILAQAGFSSELTSENIKHVHGSIKENDIIFGVDDSAAINPDDTFLYKSTNNNYNGRRVRSSLEDFSNLIVFGHSLGESDHMYFKSSISDLKHMDENLDKKMTLYYYEDSGKFQLYKQLHKLTQNDVAKLKDNIHFEEFDTSLL